MYLSRLLVQNYRNYVREEIIPHPELNFIYGENAQGKTNLLEVIFLLGTGKSLRNARDREMVRWGEDWFRLAAEVTRRDGSLQIGITYRAGEGKVLSINGQREERLAELLGLMNVVLFTPEDLQLVKGGPSERRRFLNLQLSQTNPQYYYYLQQYRRTLRQRNRLLREIRRGRGYWKRELAVWDRQLARVGGLLIHRRREAVADLAPLARYFHEKLSGGQEILDVAYSPALPGANGGSLEELVEGFLQALAAVREEEVQRGMTTIGPHRDDLLISLNSRDARSFGSQGQQRTAALSLKLAEMEYIQAQVGESPILLLDDVMSELDEGRRRLLFEVVRSRGQVFITSTHRQEFLSSASGYHYRVRQGSLERL